MKKAVVNIVFIAVVLAGLGFTFRDPLRAWLHARRGSEHPSSAGRPSVPASGERKILYYQDPMNPAHRSDKPGTDSMGMPLVPVYADEAKAASGMTPGTLRITPQKQQLIGVQTAKVEFR